MRAARLLALLAGTAGLLLAMSSPAPAASGRLESPEVPFPEGYPAAARAKVNHVLNRPDCKFLGGHWVKSSTSLRYRGETLALNQFLGELVECPGVIVHVSLKRLPDDADWRVSHDFHRNSFDVQVNLDSKRVDLESLYIPQFKGPALKP